METIYYHLEARALSVCDRASGEAQPALRRYACVHPRCAPAEGKLLNFADYAPQAAKAVAPTAAAAAPTPKRSGRLALLPDLLATAAILLMAIVVITQFLPLL